MRQLCGDLGALWIEGATVVWLRSLKLLRGGPAAAAEAELMVSEKVAAQQELLRQLAVGKLGNTPIVVTAGVTRYVLKGVRANRRRLLRG